MHEIEHHDREDQYIAAMWEQLKTVKVNESLATRPRNTGKTVDPFRYYRQLSDAVKRDKQLSEVEIMS